MQYAAQPEVIPRRAITPSPEKPPMGSTVRRAITPTPARALCDYQNLSVIQKSIFVDDKPETAGYISRKTVESVLNAQNYQNLNVIQDKIFPQQPNKGDYITKKQIESIMKKQVSRSLSADSAAAAAPGNSPPSSNDGLCVPDHLNQPRRRDSGNWSGDRNSASSSSSTTLDNPYLYLVGKRNGVPSSPTRNGGTHYDAGYDSFSLSSTDSFPPKHLMNPLAKIPESVCISSDCDKLCMEADQLLEKSKLLEEAHDFETSLVLCNAAAMKARQAMDAPYSNPHTMTFARMKHNTCVMRARSLHRRLAIEKGGEIAKEAINNINGVKHARQNSKDKTGHSRQNSRELVEKATKSIEIYATLPKKKATLKLVEADIIETEMMNLPKEEPKVEVRESRGLFSRNKDKRSRSEDRSKSTKDMEPALANAKDTLKIDKKAEKDKSKSKQHKIRRKLLMGGLIKRKNRSMPDLTEGADEPKPVKAVDDSSVGLSVSKEQKDGYLSEGHFEYSANPNLERSKLMRKSFHGSGKMLTAAKVPPPPPLRVNSSLTQEFVGSLQPYHAANVSNVSTISSNTSMSEDSCQTIITCAVVHEQKDGVDEVDCIRYGSHLELPPYPSPPSTTNHSRQASEDFPPPPPTLDLEPLNEQLNEIQSLKRPEPEFKGTTSILAQLQQRQQMLNKLKTLQESKGPKKLANIPLNTKTVRDLASRFEGVVKIGSIDSLNGSPKPVRTTMNGLIHKDAIESIDEVDCIRPAPKKFEITAEQIQEEIREVELLNQTIQQALNGKVKADPTRPKKKSVSFCDQVILVATADDDEEDAFIPNPILERVLKSAIPEKETDDVPLYSVVNKPPKNPAVPVTPQEQPPPQNYQNPLANQPQYPPQMLLNQYPPTTNFANLPLGHAGQPRVFPPPPPSQNNNNNNTNNIVNYNCYYNSDSLERRVAEMPPATQPFTVLGPMQQRIVRDTASGYPRYMPIPANSQAFQKVVVVRTQSPISSSPSNGAYLPQNYQKQFMSGSPQMSPQLSGGFTTQSPQLSGLTPQLSASPQLSGLTTHGSQVSPQFAPYQRVPMPHEFVQVAAPTKKKVTFEAGTKGSESDVDTVDGPMPAPTNFPRVFATTTPAKPAVAQPCNLCRKKPVLAPALYCTDCDFYMSRFNNAPPRT